MKELEHTCQEATNLLTLFPELSTIEPVAAAGIAGWNTSGRAFFLKMSSAKQVPFPSVKAQCSTLSSAEAHSMLQPRPFEMILLSIFKGSAPEC